MKLTVYKRRDRQQRALHRRRMDADLLGFREDEEGQKKYAIARDDVSNLERKLGGSVR